MGIFNKESTVSVASLVKKKFLFRRYFFLILGVFVYALSFNLFFLKNELVYGGVSGLAIIAKGLWQFEPSIIILISSLFLLLLSFIFLGKESTINSVVGSLLFPLFVSLTANISEMVQINQEDLLLISIIGGVTAGFGSGLVFKTGFTTGGTDILNQIVAKYFKMSLGNAMIFTDGIIVLIGGLFFGWTKVLYAMIVLYIISIMADKVVLGISESKAFYIVTDKENEVKKYILENLSHGITMLDSRGGFSNEKHKVLMCVIPTKEYFKAREGILLIDSDAFFVITDAYQVFGNDAHKNNEEDE